MPGTLTHAVGLGATGPVGGATPQSLHTQTGPGHQSGISASQVNQVISIKIIRFNALIVQSLNQDFVFYFI